VHVEGVHIGPWNQTPALVFSTEPPSDGPPRIHLLQADSDGGWLIAPTRPGTGLNQPPKQENITPGRAGLLPLSWYSTSTAVPLDLQR